MYQAKAEGRGRWVMFDPSMHDRVRERIDIELALRHALAARPAPRSRTSRSSG